MLGVLIKSVRIYIKAAKSGIQGEDLEEKLEILISFAFRKEN
jgi:hypothetical protein